MPNEIGTIIGPAKGDDGGDGAIALIRGDNEEARVHVFFSIAQGLEIMDDCRDGTDPEFWDGLRLCLRASDLAETSDRPPIVITGSPAIGIFGAIANAPELWSGGVLNVRRRLDGGKVQQCFLSPHPDVDSAMYVVTDTDGSHVVIMRSKSQVREMTEKFRHCFPPKMLLAIRGVIPDMPLPDIVDTPIIRVDGAAAGIIALAFEKLEERNRKN